MFLSLAMFSVLLVGEASANIFGAQIGRVGDNFFSNECPDIEASGLTTVPSNDQYLVGVSDNGMIFFLNLDGSDANHFAVDLTSLPSNNFEGVTIDPNDGSLYVIHEGSSGDDPVLHNFVTMP